MTWHDVQIGIWSSEDSAYETPETDHRQPTVHTGCNFIIPT